MSKKRNRIGLLLVGMFLGIIVGISIMWWGINFKQNDWISFQKIKNYIGQIMPGDDADEELLIPSASGNRGSQSQKYNSPLDTIPYDQYADSMGLDSAGKAAYYQDQYGDYYIPEDVLPDSLQWFGGRKGKAYHHDSLEVDSINRASRIQKEQILRDQFVQSRMLNILGKTDSIQKYSASLDSLLTDDKMTPKQDQHKILVELWRSPVNYRGYKFSGRKLILFGVSSFDKLSLEYINRRLYLRQGNIIYGIDHSDDFRPFIPVRKTGLVLNNTH
jgi:hypothetical protein